MRKVIYLCLCQRQGCVHSQLVREDPAPCCPCPPCRPCPPSFTADGRHLSREGLGLVQLSLWGCSPGQGESAGCETPLFQEENLPSVGVGSKGVLRRRNSASLTVSYLPLLEMGCLLSSVLLLAKIICVSDKETLVCGQVGVYQLVTDFSLRRGVGRLRVRTSIKPRDLRRSGT